MTLIEAESLYQQGKFDEAGQAFSELAGTDPLAGIPRLRLGQIHFRSRRFSEAVEAWHELNGILAEKPLQLNEEAEKLGSDIITLEELLPFGAMYSAVAQLGCLIGDAYLGLEDWQHSQAAYGQALKANPACYPAIKGLAQCHIKLREFDRARRELLDYLEENPHDAKAYRLLAMVARANGWYDQQMNLLHCALLISPGHLKSLDSVSRYLEQQNRFSEALRLFQEAIEERGENPEFLNNLARLELSISRQNPISLSPIHRAINSLERSLNLEPNQTQMQLMLSNLREVEQQTTAAVQEEALLSSARTSASPSPVATEEPPTAEISSGSAIMPDAPAHATQSLNHIPPMEDIGPIEPPKGGMDQVYAPLSISRQALSIGLAESISMLPPWEHGSESASKQPEEENIEPVSMGLEEFFTPDKLVELIEKARSSSSDEAKPVSRGTKAFFGRHSQSMQALSLGAGQGDIARLVQEAAEEEAPPVLAAPAAGKTPASVSSTTVIKAASKTTVSPVAPRPLLKCRIDPKLIRSPVKRPALGRKGAKSEMQSAWQIKQQALAIKS